MKKFLSASLLIVIIVPGTRDPVFSQQQISYNPAMPGTPTLEQRMLGVYYGDINLKAFRDLRKRFGTMKGEKWYRHKNWYTAWFTMDGINFRVEYDKHGNWSGTERDYTAEKLDHDISDLVRRSYPGYTISWIREITLSEFFDSPMYIVHGTTYIVHIENENMGKTVSVNQDTIRVMEEYPKS
ncbi:MAG TPA: hypothetical protein VE035_15465 [Puia sp.]|nr:hypothetical protein [Puia sp.]